MINWGGAENWGEITPATFIQGYLSPPPFCSCLLFKGPIDSHFCKNWQ